MTVGEGDHAGEIDEDAFACRGPPLQRATQQAVAEVERTLIVEEVRHRHAQRFVIHINTDGLSIRRVDDGLSHPRQAIGVLSVLNIPGFVESVHIGAVEGRIAAFLRVTAHAQVAVTHSKERLCHTQIRCGGRCLYPPPGVDGVNGSINCRFCKVAAQVEAVAVGAAGRHLLVVEFMPFCHRSGI